jgi:hypothetical protein
MASFPCSYEMTCPHDHTSYEHTLRSTRCPIATYHSPQEERWGTMSVSVPCSRSAKGNRRDLCQSSLLAERAPSLIEVTN